MVSAPTGWEKDRIGHLNADGKSIEYLHESKPYRAIVEAMHSDTEEGLEYYTVVFDVSNGKPWPTVEAHEIFYDKDDAQSHLHDLMKKHA